MIDLIIGVLPLFLIAWAMSSDPDFKSREKWLEEYQEDLDKERCR